MPVVPEAHFGFRLGQRSSDGILEMQEQSLVMARNCDIRTDGSIGVRRAAVDVTDPQYESSVLITPAELLEYYNGNTKEILLAGGTKWYKWDATGTSRAYTAVTGATGFTDGADWSLVRWRDATRNWVIGGQTGQDTVYYDGTSVQSLGLSYQFVLLAFWQGYIMGVEANSNLLRFSRVAEPTNFLSTDAVVLNDPTGSSITCIGAHGDTFLYMGRNQTNRLSGMNRYSFQPKILPGDVGCVSQHTFASTPIGAIWLGEDGLYVWNGGEQPERLSTPIDGVFEAMDFTKMSIARAAYYKSPLTKMRKYVLAITYTGQREDVFIVEYNLDSNGWSIRSGDQARAFCVGHDSNDMHLLYAIDDSTRLYKWDQDALTRQSIDFNMIDRPFTFGHPAADKTLQKAFLYYQANTPSNMKIRITPDFHGTPYEETFTLVADTAVPVQYQYDMTPTQKHFLQKASAREKLIEGLGITGRHFQVQLQNSEVGKDFRILGIAAQAFINAEQWRTQVVVTAQE